ncbi:ribonuclease 2-like [Trifolium pratense]|uniref:ribonuclease 2-like n=1 Tax=Trifolium pratense TaxID=57577 RepID=UPI001E690547|nr:ribonuclease 2-like [Trifolium pratense]
MYLTVHGLWAGKGSIDLNDCQPKTPIKDAEMNEILKQENLLNMYWPSLSTKDNKAFWRHEWLAHGTCSIPLLGQIPIQYFQLTLQLYQNHKVQNLLDNTGLLKKESASREAIRKAIHDITNFNPQIKCVKIEEKEYLVEVRLCFTASKTSPILKDCPTTLSSCFADNVYF